MDDKATNNFERLELVLPDNRRRRKSKKNKAKTHDNTFAKGDYSSHYENNFIGKNAELGALLFERIRTDPSQAVDIMSLVHPIPVEDGIWEPIHVKLDGEGREKFKYGEPLVEIYAVRIGDLGGKQCAKVHGKIVLGCRYRHICLLNIDKENALELNCEDSFQLNGPDVAPLGSDAFSIALDLKEDGDEFCRKLIFWSGSSSFHFDTWFNVKVIGKKGSVDVIYTVFKAAWLAEVHLQLTKLANGKSNIRIEGSVTVYFDDMQYLRTIVLNKSRDELFTIKLFQDIPLSRSLFCCRVGSSVVVKIDLKDCDNNQPLVQGALLFPPTYYGDTMGTLSGQNGEIQVNVVWMDYCMHPKTRGIMSNSSAYEKEVPLFE